MKHPALFLSCIVVLLLLLIGCGPEPRYSGNVRTGRVTDHRPEATTTTAAPSVAPRGTQEAQDTVYATRTGKRYHRQSCRHARASGTPISRQEAEAKGLTPCKVCKP